MTDKNRRKLCTCKLKDPSPRPLPIEYHPRSPDVKPVASDRSVHSLFETSVHNLPRHLVVGALLLRVDGALGPLRLGDGTVGSNGEDRSIVGVVLQRRKGVSAREKSWRNDGL